MKLAVWLWCLPALAAQSVTVTGTVTNAITHEPIAGAKLIIFGSDHAHETLTDTKGAFRIQRVQGCCRLLFDKDGFETVGPSRLDFTAATNPLPLNLAMLPWPTLRGRVLDTEQQPIGSSTVKAISTRRADKTTIVGADGAFALQIPPGEYSLYAIPAAPHVAGSSELAPTYFPDKTERSNAQKVTCKAGEDISGFDIVLQRVNVFHVSGRVVDERGASAAGAALQLSAATKIVADHDGNFEFPRVQPGTDILRADWSQGETAFRGFAPVTVKDHDIENITVRVAAPMTVLGAFELDGKPAKAEGVAFLEPVDGIGTEARASIGPAGIRFDGVYPGRYRVEVNVNPGFGHPMYLESVGLGERDITLEEFDVTPGMLPLRVMLRTGGGRVRGAVTDGTGGIIVLVPQQEHLRSLLAVSFFSGDYFAVENVRPGDYYAFAIRGSFNYSDIRDPAYAGAVLARATAVRVELNGTATVTLSYARAQ